MSCGYCFSIIEFLEDFICLKTFHENNMSNSIIIRQLGKPKLNKQKHWDLFMSCRELAFPQRPTPAAHQLNLRNTSFAFNSFPL